jgi:hypothetical protein
MKSRVGFVLACLFLALPLSVFVGVAHAGNLTLSYTAPTTCEDNSAIANCPTTGFEVSEGASQAGTYAVKETVAANVLSRTYLNIAPGTRCYFVKTVSNTVKSAESIRVCADVPSLPPKAPQGITVKVEVTVSTP